MNKKLTLSLIFLLLVSISVFTFLTLTTSKHPNTNISKKTKPSITKKTEKKWIEKGAAIPGNFADAEIVKTKNGFRMFYSAEPEVKGFNGQVYTSISSDGIKWTNQKEILQMATFPSVLEVTGGYRMYYQSMDQGEAVIKSSFSKDGEDWTNESGARLVNPKKIDGVTIDRIAAPTVEKIDDKTYLMVFRGSYEKQYKEGVPNKNTSLLFFATSGDSLNFSSKGLAVDTRNEEMNGMADGPELFINEGKIDLYYWGYNGVYISQYKNGLFGEGKLELEPFNKSENMVFPPNPPGDPTVIKIDNQMYMYYGQHKKGIYFAVK